MKIYTILIYVVAITALIFFIFYFISLYQKSNAIPFRSIKQSNTISIRPDMSQKEINKILATNKKVKFLNGIYNIDAEIGLKPSSNQVIVFDSKAEIRSIPNDKEDYEIIKLNNIKNTTISGGKIIGERYSHKGTTGEWGMGISLNDCSNIKIKDMIIRDCWGDGIYLGASECGYNKNIEITNCTIDNNRRQGISVISAVNLTIDSTKIMNINGTAPSAGIDFEPNYSTQKLKKNVVKNLYTYNTEGAGILIATENVPYVDITIINHKHDGGERAQYGLCVNFADIKQKGSITDINPVYINTNDNPVQFNNENSNAAPVYIKNLSTTEKVK
ncbi:right-handed parallel beta-helix repeat-containing protein [Clostridium sp. P21]|uniref:Right-handed parallel beta-helix repeat-containing protein n=1 Tax=Clostridium muellerianum TaxID=2716538 RepID=A0A7Y0EHP8_9CLOT|nr:right-handed parallel beta-helix repeat-containing protein [Clostridium muellerianum]NMM63684.1 right-handed parallel beta-helix repeat-containing protein [Clostridium muellerianum]